MTSELRATYRLQLGPGLTFADARALVPYLRELGISHLYLSPVLQARRGSSHGYDVVEPRRVSRVLGGEQGLRELSAAGLGIVLDIVPNHMATSDDENPFWRDPVLRARFFDVDEESGAHRRFFDIDDLGGLRVEDPEVFETTHRLVLDLVREGVVEGLRIDHPDGLADPRGYLERLRAEGVERVWVEKILEPGELLRGWPVEGTTGYDFLNEAESLFVDPAGEAVLTELAGEPRPFAEVAFDAKLEQAETTFQREVARLRRLLDVPELERALASLPVYRTYVEPWSGRVDQADRDAVAGLPEELRRVLLLEERGHDEFVTRFQQTTGPVMAKGVEDTAFYRYVRLLALNEVGGDPGRFGLSVEKFHRRNAERAAHFPNTLLPGTTHDTKRSADVRARIGALAGMAERWGERVLAWRELAEPLREGGAPDWPEELLVYQTLVGAWPIEADRLEQYLEKALREAKRNTTWVEPNARWEEAVKRFCRSLLEHEPFLADFEPFAAEVAAAGARSAIGQLVLRLTAPGVPDVYGGDELLYLALVDPDNRRPVDWDARRRALAGLGRPTPETVKLYVIREALALRARRPEAFAGAYEPLPAAEGTCAYRRGDDVVVALPVRGGEPELELPSGKWRDVLPGVAQALGGFRVALLERGR
ncbi:MAG TPA: malto-oligosyltrehalose synthase [Gaiellaceae bacterium]|jgi:(1->4)-alpha-D-glucan 1-alpha-D-glucosylmutase